MSVNTMSIEQSYQLINKLHKLATGQDAPEVVDLSGFVSVAQSTLRAGYEPIMNAISVVIGDTIVAVRAKESGALSGLEFDAMRWGGIKRKINFVEDEATENKRWIAIDGQSVDQYEIRKPKILETHFYGFDTYSNWRSIYEDQIQVAFSSPAELGAFFTGLAVHYNNMYMQWKEEQRRALVCNLAGVCATNGGDRVIHLLTEYNAETGLALTAQTVYQPENFSAFIRWTAARLNTLARMMSERSEKYQQVITGMPIMRHTAPEFLRAYMLGSLKDKIDAVVRSTTYDNSYLRLVESEGVSYWQAIDSPDEIKVKPAYVDSNLEIASAEEIELDNVVGIFMDRDAAGYSIIRESVEATPKNVRGGYYNLFMNADIQLMNDATEKAVILMLD